MFWILVGGISSLSCVIIFWPDYKPRYKNVTEKEAEKD